jgi:cytochrome P450
VRFALTLQVLHRNIQEALRLFPPLIILMRYVKETFSVTDSKGRQFVISKVIFNRHRATGILKCAEEPLMSSHISPV